MCCRACRPARLLRVCFPALVCMHLRNAGERRCARSGMGGKRKSKKKVVAKAKPKLSTAFKCPFCAHEMSCKVELCVSLLLSRAACAAAPWCA